MYTAPGSKTMKLSGVVFLLMTLYDLHVMEIT